MGVLVVLGGGFSRSRIRYLFIRSFFPSLSWTLGMEIIKGGSEGRLESLAEVRRAADFDNFDVGLFKDRGD